MADQQALTSTTQQFLDIHDVTNDLLILKTGGVSLIVTVMAMNFGLLAEEEQDAIIYGYAGLLNSLNYSIQIVIRSQTKDITNYINLLKEKEEETINHVRKEQIRRYREFIADLVQERNVLDKKFYVVIPATALELGLVTTQSVIPGIKSPDITTFDRSIILERSKNLLEPKRDHIISQFARIGLFSRQLNTQEIIQLFYTSYNPEASDGQKMADTRQYTTTVVEANTEERIFGDSRAQMPDNMRPQPAVVDDPTNAEASILEQAFSDAPPQQQPIPTPVVTSAEPARIPQTPTNNPVYPPQVAPQARQLPPADQPLPPPAELT